MSTQDPLWKLRHALAGVGLALLLSVFAAAFAGAALGDLIGGAYGTRVALYAGLLVYVLTGAAVLFVKVATDQGAALFGRQVFERLAEFFIFSFLFFAMRRDLCFFLLTALLAFSLAGSAFFGGAGFFAIVTLSCRKWSRQSDSNR